LFSLYTGFDPNPPVTSGSSRGTNPIYSMLSDQRLQGDFVMVALLIALVARLYAVGA
jgi:hypothetical protein